MPTNMTYAEAQSIRTATPIEPPRDPMSGRFVQSDAAYGITTVMIPGRAGVCGWRVGAKGQIFARREDAIRKAMHRRPSDAVPAVKAAERSPVATKGFESLSDWARRQFAEKHGEMPANFTGFAAGL